MTVVEFVGRRNVRSSNGYLAKVDALWLLEILAERIRNLGVHLLTPA